MKTNSTHHFQHCPHGLVGDAHFLCGFHYLFSAKTTNILHLPKDFVMLDYRLVFRDQISIHSLIQHWRCLVLYIFLFNRLGSVSVSAQPNWCSITIIRCVSSQMTIDMNCSACKPKQRLRAESYFLLGMVVYCWWPVKNLQTGMKFTISVYRYQPQKPIGSKMVKH